MKRLRVGLFQINANQDWSSNLQRAEKAFVRAAGNGCRLLAFPETFFWRGASKDFSTIAAEAAPAVLKRFRELAASHRVAVLLGSLLEQSPQRGKFYNTSVMIDAQGRIKARYRKIHLFDIDLPGRVKTRESQHIAAGKLPVTFPLFGVRWGMTICYDLRFPELFRKLAQKGAQVIFVPANFTYETGKAHWEVLLRARAVENQCFIIAPGQSGTHPSNRIRSFGNSLIIDPWGRILRRAGVEGERLLSADLDFELLAKVRRNLPALKHRRIR